MRGYEQLKARLSARGEKSPLPAEQAERRVATAGGPVRDTAELQRILALPRRDEDPQGAEWLADKVTQELKTPGGTMRLRPVQAMALVELAEAAQAGTNRGIFSPARVGAGKTLISMLSPTVVGAQRPLLLVPSKLLKKTQREVRELRKHWPISPLIHVETYEKISRVSGSRLLEVYRPDMIIADECHKLKNRSAAVTRRVYRYMKDHQDTTFVALSGTITKRSLTDYGHILEWTHKAERPVPTSFTELEEWSLALDEKVSPLNRKQVGALVRFCNDEELGLFKQDPIMAARRGYQRRLVDTQGVVSTPEAFIGASIQVTQLPIPAVTEIVAAFNGLRHEWMLPDGVDLADPREITRHARELALGFYYRWNPAPPQAWMDARRKWNKFVRTTLGANHLHLDSMLQVANAVDSGLIDGQDILGAWREIEPTFKPRTETVWLTDSVVRQCEEWGKTHAGIIWCSHVEFARRLSRESGIPYYGQQGLTESGRFIDDHPAGQALIASIESNNEGRNLQAWSENLIVSVPQNGLQWEQLMGRTHRDGQEADEVGFDVLVGCYEHVKHFEQSVADARYQQDTLGQPQKLLYADVDMPATSDLEPGLKNGTCPDCRMHPSTYAGKLLVK